MYRHCPQRKPLPEETKQESSKRATNFIVAVDKKGSNDSPTGESSESPKTRCQRLHDEFLIIL